MASKRCRPIVNSLVSQSTDKEQFKHVDNMYIKVGRIGATLTSRRQDRSCVWQHFGELRYRCVNVIGMRSIGHCARLFALLLELSPKVSRRSTC